MDFYAAQDSARRRSRVLILLFALAIVVVIVLLSLATVAWVSPFHGYQDHLRSLDALGAPAAAPTLFDRIVAQPGASLAIVAGWALVLLTPVVWRSVTLSRSGEVARSLGGVPVRADTRDPTQRRLLNVVEEMAIASGLPVPQVYVLESEPSINAFAAGLSQAQATVGITRGALDALDRDQLQGVIAHEFSHILNGDMRLNVRLIAWIAGLFGIAQLGRVLAQGRQGNNPSGTIVLALPMIVLGTVGVAVGRLLQAGISRQREWLADASAVQFTRNPHGLRGALIAIATQRVPAGLQAPRADESAHLFFSSGVRRWFATHPPITERIRVLDRSARQLRLPGADRPSGAVPDPAGGAWQPASSGLASPIGSVAGTAGNPAVDGTRSPAALAARAGTVDPSLASFAGDLLRTIPAAVRDAVSPRQAADALLALALGHEAPVRERQLEAIARHSGGECAQRVRRLQAQVCDLEPRLRLPAVQTLFPRLRSLSVDERSGLAVLLNRLALADGTMDTFEFCIARLASTWLRDARAVRESGPRLALADVREAAGLLLSVLAWQGAGDDSPRAQAAAAAGLARLPGPPPAATAPPSDWAPRLWRAFDQLDRLWPHDKRALIEALAAVVLHDRQVLPAEGDLLRTACAVLHCPLPLLDGP